jgi:hypothetical protein
MHYSCAMARFAASAGGLENTHRRFCRWRDKGIREGLLERLVDEPDCEWLMIDASPPCQGSS